MKYAYINGKILDGTKDMQVKEDFVILTDNDKIKDIVKAGTDLNGYERQIYYARSYKYACSPCR